MPKRAVLLMLTKFEPGLDFPSEGLLDRQRDLQLIGIYGYKETPMARKLEVVYEDGVLKPLEDPGLMDHERAVIEIKERCGTSSTRQKRRTFGSAKGLITIAADFDEPLEDFREYT